jgi:hypothetical protein
VSERKKGIQGSVCKRCDALRVRPYNERDNPRKNAVSALAYQWAGGSKAFYGLPREQRLKLRAQATGYIEAVERDNEPTIVPQPRTKFTHAQLPRIIDEQKKRYADADSAEARARDGFVYVIYHDLFPDAVKIGKARNPNKRLADANTWCPEGEFKLHDAIFDRDAMSLERAVHAAAKSRSLQLDGEWFSMNRWHAANLIRKVKRDDSSNSGFGSRQPAAGRHPYLATERDGGPR